MSHQATLSDTGRDPGSTGAKNISDFLQNDEGVEALTDAEVRDVWVRMTFAKNLFRAGKWHDDERHYEAMLTEGEGSELIELAIHLTDRHSDLTQALGWEDGPGNVRTLWGRWTKESVESDDMTMTEIAREKIKTTLRGSGMPRMIVARGRVAYHNEVSR